MAFNSPGVVQRGRAGQAAVLRLLHQFRPGQHGFDHEPGQDRGHALQVGLRHGHELLVAARQPRIAFGRRHRLRPGELHEGLRRVRRRDQERRKDAPRGEDGDPQRRSPGHRGVHRVQDEGRAQGARPDRAGLQLLDRRRSLLLRFLPECEPFRARHRRFHARRRGRPRLVDPQRERRQACREIPRARSDAQDGRIRLAVRRSRHAVRHHDQSLAHLQGHGPHQRLESLLGVHVPRRYGLQPGLAQPAEVPRRSNGQFDSEGFRHAVDVTITAQEILVDNASYPTREDRAQFARLSARSASATRISARC